jgi:hypothetical protein
MLLILFVFLLPFCIDISYLLISYGKDTTNNSYHRAILKLFFGLLLHPMVIFGTFFGAIMFYFGNCGEFPLINDTPFVNG